MRYQEFTRRRAARRHKTRYTALARETAGLRRELKNKTRTIRQSINRHLASLREHRASLCEDHEQRQEMRARIEENMDDHLHTSGELETLKLAMTALRAEHLEVLEDMRQVEGYKREHDRRQRVLHFLSPTRGSIVGGYYTITSLMDIAKSSAERVCDWLPWSKTVDSAVVSD
jgi:chromosome segregation ATPase